MLIFQVFVGRTSDVRNTSGHVWALQKLVRPRESVPENF